MRAWLCRKRDNFVSTGGRGLSVRRSFRHPGRSIRSVKVEAIEYGDRRVYSVASFNRGVAEWLARLPTVWVEGEVTELRRQDRWQSVFLTLKDPDEGACLAVTMPRGQFDALRLDLANGERVHVVRASRAVRGPRRLPAAGPLDRALRPRRPPGGARAAEAEARRGRASSTPSRKRPLPRLPRRIGLVTGNDAAAKKDVLTAITARFPPARLLVAETYVQGPRAAAAIADALRAISEAPEIDVVVLARGGGSFEDLLPFSDERLVRAIAACPVPVVSAVGHEQDTPLSDLVADARASTPTAAARLVVPDLAELTARLERSRAALATGARRALDRERRRLDLSRDHLRRAPLLLVERRRAAVEHSAGRLRALSPRATLDRGYAIVRTANSIVRAGSEVATGTQVDVELGTGGFGATVEDTR